MTTIGRVWRTAALGAAVACAGSVGLTAQASAQTRVEREAMTARFKLDLLGNEVPDVRAAAAIVYDPRTGEVLWGQNQHDQRSIASLTKLMTAVTFLAAQPDLSRVVVVAASDVRSASVTYLRTGERISYENLLHLALIASDNGAARVLARTSEGGTGAFIERMNQMATYLGLTSTHYADPSGLDSRNISSAYDISHLIAFASQIDPLSGILRMPSYEVRTNQRRFTVKSTNRLLDAGLDVLAGKTGFIRAAGYCLATLLQAPQGSQVAVVVLGAANSTLRFWEARHLLEWVATRTSGVLGSEIEITSLQPAFAP